MKIAKIFSLCMVAALLVACNYNEDHFAGLDELAQPKNVASYEYELTSADITTIVSALRANRTAEDSVLATALNASKIFSPAIPSNRLIPYALKRLYYSADLGSVAKVTFPYAPDRDETLVKLSQPSYTLNADDYKQVWGSPTDYVSALTPAKSPAAQIPAILLGRKPAAVSGDYAIVQYNYSAQEPEISVTEVRYLYENFDGISGNGSSVPIALPGWINKDITGTRFWQCRALTGNSNQYAQFSSNNTNQENTIWLIAPVDLTAGIDPKFLFDIAGGYYKGDVLSVHVSENFDGTEGGIAAATWTDISSHLNIPTTPEIPTESDAIKYSTWRSSDIMDFSAYAGKKVYIAFKYAGNGVGNVATTTFQIDNIKVAEIKSAMSIASFAPQYAAYTFNGTAWTPVAASANILLLQPEDYVAMGFTGANPYLSAAQATAYLPIFLSQKFPFVAEGTEKTLVYKSAATANNAVKYTFTAGEWTVPAATEMRTEQYVVSSQGWMFDPTVTLAIVRNVTTSLIQTFITYVQNEMSDKWFPKGTYTNEEHYFGFNAYYGQIGYGSDRVLYGDPAIKALSDNNEARWALFDERAAIAFPIFARLNYPLLQTHVSGVEQLLKVRIEHYFSNSDRRYFEHTLKCIKSGSAGSPAEFEYIGKEQIEAI
jgi:hypothetical protein